jgi:hypothetical protein
MANALSTPALKLSGSQREALTRLSRSTTASYREVQRAKVFLLADDGLANTAIGARVGVSPTTGKPWRQRCECEGLKGLVRVRPGRGRKPRIGAGDRARDAAREARR